MKNNARTAKGKRFLHKDAVVGHVFAAPFIFGFIWFFPDTDCNLLLLRFYGLFHGSKNNHLGWWEKFWTASDG